MRMAHAVTFRRRVQMSGQFRRRTFMVPVSSLSGFVTGEAAGCFSGRGSIQLFITFIG